MKKILLLTIATVIFSCTQDETTNNQDNSNCNCDRVVEVFTFNIIGTPQQPATVYFSNYTTINDCTQIQREKTFSTTNASLSPQIGECR
jgi:hypothetical protein